MGEVPGVPALTILHRVRVVAVHRVAGSHPELGHLHGLGHGLLVHHHAPGLRHQDGHRLEEGPLPGRPVQLDTGGGEQLLDALYQVGVLGLLGEGGDGGDHLRGDGHQHILVTIGGDGGTTMAARGGKQEYHPP